MKQLEVDLCVVGAGSAGLTAASVAAQLGRRVVLIERGEMGGECLNDGCVPSKALLAAAKAAHAVRESGRFGIRVAEPAVDFAAVIQRVHAVIAAIAPHDSVERFEKLGAQVIRDRAVFVEPRVLTAGDVRIKARRVIVATGSAPVVPKVEGLEGVPFLTNQTIFANRTLPDHLLIVGAGPIGIEMAQAHARLGSRVTVVDNGLALSHDDRELVDPLLACLAGEGIDIRENTKVVAARTTATGVRLEIEAGGLTSTLDGSHLLVAAGRRARTDTLDLDRGGVKFDGDGIVVDRHLRTSARGVYAVGDVVAGAPRFTHVAGYQAGIAVQNALTFNLARVDYASLPWVTYTEPELAHVGASEAEARQRHGDDVRIVRSRMAGNDRAQTDGETTGLVKLVARGNGRVLGATILAAHAGELAHVWVVAIRSGLKLKEVARMIAPYPTLGEANKAAAGEFYKAQLFSALTRRVVGLLGRLP